MVSMYSGYGIQSKSKKEKSLNKNASSTLQQECTWNETKHLPGKKIWLVQEIKLKRRECHREMCFRKPNFVFFCARKYVVRTAYQFKNKNVTPPNYHRDPYQIHMAMAGKQAPLLSDSISPFSWLEPRLLYAPPPKIELYLRLLTESISHALRASTHGRVGRWENSSLRLGLPNLRKSINESREKTNPNSLEYTS